MNKIKNFYICIIFLKYLFIEVLAIAMGGVSLLTLLIPEAAKLGGKTGYPYYLIIVRFFMGVCEAGTFPCITGKNIDTIICLKLFGKKSF